MKNAVLALLVSLMTLEVFSFAATKANLLLFNEFQGSISRDTRARIGARRRIRGALGTSQCDRSTQIEML